MMAEAEKPAANPWRGEVGIAFGDVTTVLRCRMEHFAMLADDLEVKTLMEVYDLWKRLAPDAMRRSLRILAQSPAEGDALWAACPGTAGLMQLQEKLFMVTSGKTPDDIARESEARKKLDNWLAAQNETVIEGLAARITEMTMAA